MHKYKLDINIQVHDLLIYTNLSTSTFILSLKFVHRREDNNAEDRMIKTLNQTKEKIEMYQIEG